jgi:two-component system, NarL family, response regulator NreC
MTPGSGVTTVVLADDHPVVRQGLRSLLEAEGGFEVLGVADDGLEAVRQVERLKPHVLVVDLMMPGMNGFEVARQLTESGSHTRVIVLTMHTNDAYVQEALRGGAAGYVLKDSSDSELVDAVRAVAAGRRYLSAALAERAIDDYAERAKQSGGAQHETLSAREREILQLVAEGHPSSEIGARLHLSPRTVETHRASLMRKLGLRTRTDLLRYAFRHGILPLE